MAAASIPTSIVSGFEATSDIPPTIPLEANDSALDSPSSEETLETNEASDSPPKHLITSPYTTPEHILDLSTLSTPNRLLAQSLTVLTLIRPDYATAPYTESFNWNSVFEELHKLAQQHSQTQDSAFVWHKQSFYVVAFRSILKPDADPDRLHLLDERSHAEAVQSGGLLKYWFGVKNERKENLATCVWRSREDARAGGTGPWHAQARGAARTMYEKIEFTTLELVIEEGVDGFEFKEWRH